MRPSFQSLQNLTHKRTTYIIKRQSLTYLYAKKKKITRKEQGCLFDSISREIQNRHCQKKKGKPTLSAADFQSYIKACIILGQSMIAHVKAMINEDARISLKEIAGTPNISLGSVSSVLFNGHSYHKVCTRQIPSILRSQQRRDRVAHSTVLLKV